MYLLFCMCYPESVNFIEFLMEFCIYDNIVDTIQITGKKFLHFKLSKAGQILRVDKTCFPRPGHIFRLPEHGCSHASILTSRDRGGIVFLPFKLLIPVVTYLQAVVPW